MEMSKQMEVDLRSDSETKYPKLHVMGFGELLDTALSLYRKHFWSFLSVSAGYCPAMFLMISVFLSDDPFGRGAKVVIWIPTIGVFWGEYKHHRYVTTTVGTYLNDIQVLSGKFRTLLVYHDARYHLQFPIQYRGEFLREFFRSRKFMAF